MKLFAWLSVAASIVAAPGAMAQSPDATQLSCPVRYWLMDKLCLDSATGDVVLAAPPGPSDDARR